MYRPKCAAALRIAMIGAAAVFSVLSIETISTTAHRAPAEHWTQKSLAEARAVHAARAEQQRPAAEAMTQVAHAD